MAHGNGDGNRRGRDFLLQPGTPAGLAQRDTDATGGLDRAAGQKALADAVARIEAAQEKLWADRRWAVLVVLQGLDTAGKDGVIKHVLSGVNPQGVQVTSFAGPNTQELAHDYLWRVHRAVPGRGTIGVFNRSHYEEVLVPRVRPDILAAQGLPDTLIQPTLWQDRLEDIAAFERYLARQGIVIVKLFLHISKGEQRERLLARLDDPEKTWKFDPADLAVHRMYDTYLGLYEDALSATAAPHAPWYAIPADRKWFARLTAAEILADTLEALDLHAPKPAGASATALAAARAELRGEASGS